MLIIQINRLSQQIAYNGKPESELNEIERADLDFLLNAHTPQMQKGFTPDRFTRLDEFDLMERARKLKELAKLIDKHPHNK